MTSYNVPSVKHLRSLEKNKPAFEVISLFAGGGGSSTGYRMAGGKVLAVNEFVPEAIKTYQANWPSTKILLGDVRKLTGAQILKEVYKKPKEVDVLDGSPPCSAFSTVGSREKGWGKTKKYSDVSQSNVEDLFFDYIRILREIQPKTFVAENVAGLAKGRSKGYLNLILRELRSSGYYVACKILDAKWLGVPQSRARAIFVGIRDDLWREDMKGKTHPTPHRNLITLQDAFQGLELTAQDRVETNITKYATYQELKKLKQGEQSKKYFQLVKASPSAPSGCITASSGTGGIACIRHWDNRAFTVAEVKRIMSIPDDYILTGTYKQQVERLGRMVPPLMMKAVADQIVSLGVFRENT